MPRQSREFFMWFDVPDDPDQGRIEIRHLLDGEIRRESKHDLVADTRQTIIRMVHNWENFKDVDGKQLECNDANKLRYAKEGWFVPFVVECRVKTAAAFAEAEKKRLGN